MNNKSIDLLVLPSIENIEAIVKDIPVNLTKAFYCNLEFRFKNNAASILYKGRDIKTFSLVWLSSYWATRDLATTVKLYLDSFNIPNTYVEQSTSKLTDNMNFVLNDIPSPDTYYIESTNVIAHVKDIEATCGYPMIVKDTKGCHGVGSVFINSRKELIDCLKSNSQKKKFLFQKYILNEYDWGVLVANNKVVSAERSYAQNGEFRNNVGAIEKFIDLNEVPEEIKDLAIKAGSTLGLSWSRSDIIIEKGTGLPFLLEVNRFPGITADSTEVNGAATFINNYLEMNNFKTNPAVSKEIVGIYDTDLLIS